MDPIVDATGVTLSSSADAGIAAAVKDGMKTSPATSPSTTVTDLPNAEILQAAGLQLVEIGGQKVLAKEVVVNGQTVLKTIAEMATDAAKVAGADQRFQEAAALRKQNDKAHRLLDLATRSRDESLEMDERIAAFRGMGIEMGEDPAAVDEFIKTFQAPATPATIPASHGAEKPPVKIEDYPPEIQEAVRAYQSQQQAIYRKTIFETVENSVDDDDILGKLGTVGEAGKKSPREILKTLAKNEIQRRVVAEKEDFSADMIVSVLQTLRPLAQMIGRPGASEVIDQLPQEVVDQLNLGEASSGNTPGLHAAGIDSPSGANSGELPDITDDRWLTKFMRQVQTHKNRKDLAARSK